MTTPPLTARTAIVTGGSRGIGKAISLALAEAGAKVVVAARSDTESTLSGTIRETVAEIEAAGGKALAVKCDVTSGSDVNAMVQAAVEAYGSVDILVNNAGMLYGPNFMDTDLDDFDNLWRVNVLGPLLCARAVLPHMIERRRGSIISISSSLADSNNPHNNIYSASKAALNRMMFKLATEVREHDIAVNLIYPGLIGSEGMVARVGARFAERLPLPVIVGPPVVWAAGQTAESVTGQILDVDGFGSEWP